MEKRTDGHPHSHLGAGRPHLPNYTFNHHSGSGGLVDTRSIRKSRGLCYRLRMFTPPSLPPYTTSQDLRDLVLDSPGRASN